MNYDNLELKPYECRYDDDNSTSKCILSFNERKHLKVSAITKTIMDYFDGKRTLSEISQCLQENNINFSITDLEKFTDDVLRANSLLVGQDCKENRKSPVWFKLPIISSEKLKFIFNILKTLYNKNMAIFINILILLSLGYNVVILNSGQNFDSQVNYFIVILLVFISLVFHEFGHVSAAYYYNTNVGKIGIGLYMIFPVMYVDMTNIWRLDNKKRVVVDLGGIYFQLIFIIILTIISICTKNLTFITTNITIGFFSIANLNPLFKLDGYWILSDYFGFNNISTKAYSTIGNIIIRKKIKEKKSFIIASIIYVISTVAMMCFGLYLGINALLNMNIFIEKTNLLISYINSNNSSELFRIANEIFRMFIPIAFILMLSINLFKFLITFFYRFLSNIHIDFKFNRHC